MTCLNRHGCELIEAGEDEDFGEEFCSTTPPSDLNSLAVKFYLSSYLPRKVPLTPDSAEGYIEALRAFSQFLHLKGYWTQEAAATASASCEAARVPLLRAATASALLHELVAANSRSSSQAGGAIATLEGTFKVTSVLDDSVGVVPDETAMGVMSLPLNLVSQPVSSFEVKLTAAITEQLWQDDCISIGCRQQGSIWVPVSGGDVYPDGGPHPSSRAVLKLGDEEEDDEEVEWDDCAPPLRDPSVDED